MLDQAEIPVVERTRRDGFARSLDQRVVAGADRQGNRAQHAQAHACRGGALFQRITILQSVDVNHAGAGGGEIRGAHHMKLDHHVGFFIGLKILAAVDRIGIAGSRGVPLAQQRTPRGIAGFCGGPAETVRIRTGAGIEFFQLVGGGFGAGAGRQCAGQQQHIGRRSQAEFIKHGQESTEGAESTGLFGPCTELAGCRRPDRDATPLSGCARTARAGAAQNGTARV